MRANSHPFGPVVAAMAFLCAGAGAQRIAQPSAPVDRNTGAPPPAQLEGIWPTDALQESLLTRLADRIAEPYNLDEGKKAQLRRSVVRRWQSFLTAHRAKLQPILNEYLEMRLAVEPPEQEDIQSLAQRAIPMFEQLRNELAAGTDDFRAVLDQRQRTEFEKRVLELGLALGYADDRLQRWSRGEADPRSFWQPPRKSREQRNKVARAAQPAAESEQAQVDPLDAELTSWAEYVERFAREHKLDTAQQVAAASLLGELTQRARVHATLHREEIAHLEADISEGLQSGHTVDEIKSELMRLYGPIDSMFVELQRRLLALLSAEQISQNDGKTGAHAVSNRPQEVGPEKKAEPKNK